MLEEKTCCCSRPALNEDWVIGNVETPAGVIPQVRTLLTKKDKVGAIKVRCAIGRNNYIVTPGLYAAGSPTDESMVFVSANYKLSFDHLRRALDGIDCWILVLDTKGVNVWCAAGKRTFSTDEIINQVIETELLRIVSHHKLIVPQLGAPGVSAVNVRKECGFSVIYGPVRANDIPAFINADFKATPEMRKVQFTLRDRIAVIPVELVIWFKQALGIAVVLSLLSGITHDGYTFTVMPKVFGMVFAGWLTGGAIVPALLPWLPGRSFAIKGLWCAIILWGIFFISKLTGSTMLENSGWLLMLSAIVSFMSLNFTGTSTYTSMSGVKKEMKIAMPIQIAAVIAGLIFIVWGGF